MRTSATALVVAALVAAALVPGAGSSVRHAAAAEAIYKVLELRGIAIGIPESWACVEDADGWTVTGPDGMALLARSLPGPFETSEDAVTASTAVLAGVMEDPVKEGTVNALRRGALVLRFQAHGERDGARVVADVAVAIGGPDAAVVVIAHGPEAAFQKHGAEARTILDDVDLMPSDTYGN